MLDEVTGHDTALALLRSHRTEAHSSYIFHGPDGVGKRYAAIHFFEELCAASGITAERHAKLRALIDKNEHQDLHLMEPKGQSYGLEQIQNMIADSMVHPQESGTPYKMYVLDNAGAMTANAANALLKVLEDGPPRSTFVFVVEDIQTIIDTIRSRSIPVRFSTLDPATVLEVLGRFGSDEEKAKLCANLSGGSIGRGLEFFRGGDLGHRDTALDLLSTLRRRPYHQVLDIVEKAEKPRLLMYLLRHLLADVARLGAGLDDSLANFDKVSELRDIQTNLGVGTVALAIEELNGLYARSPLIKATFPTHLKCSMLKIRRAVRAESHR